MTAKRIDVIDVACEEYSQEVLGFSDTISSGNPTPFYDPIVSTTYPTLTLFGNSDFLLEEVDAFLAVEDEPTSSDYYQPYLDLEGDILLLEAFLNDDPSPPPYQGNYMPEVRKELKICEAHSEKSSVDEPHVTELKEIPPHLEYAFLEGDDKLPVIIAKDLSVEEKTALITILKSHKRAIAWKLSDIKGKRNSLQSCLSHLDQMLKRCEDTNLCLNWEKSHFMVKEGDDANKHLDKFLHVTHCIKVNGVTDDALCLYLFPHSLTHHATAWFDRLPRNLINTFEQMAKMFLGKYFPPFMVTKLINEITNFHQRGTFMKRRPEECYDLIENMTAHHNDWDTLAQRSESSSSITSSFDTKIAALKAEMAEINKNLMRVLQVNQQVKAVTPNCETYGGPRSYTDFPATIGQTQNVYAAGAYQGSRTLPSNTITNPKEDLKGITARSGTAYQGPTTPTTSSSASIVECETEVTKDTVHPTNNGSTKDVQPSVVQAETPIQNSEPIVTPIIEPVVVLINLLTNKDKLSELARTPLNEHCSTVLLKKLPEKLRDPGKFLIPCDFSRMDECLALADLSASINLMPLSMWNKLSLPKLSPTCMTLELADRSISPPVGVAEDVFVKVGTFHFLADFVAVDFDADPRVPLILRRSFLKTKRALIDVFEGELTLRVGKEAITFNLYQTSRYSANYNDIMANRIDVIDMACEEYSQEVLGFSDVITSGNPTPYYDSIVSTSSPTLTPFGDSDFLLEEVDAFLALKDDPTSPEELKIYEAKSDKSSIDEPLEVELKDLPPNLEYAFLEGDDKLLIIIAKYLSVEEKSALITVLKSHKRNITWKLSDIKVPHGLPTLQTTMRETSLSRIKSSEGVYTSRKPLTFTRLATMDPPGDIMAQTTLLKRFHNEMKCHKIPSKFVRFSTFEASTSWGRFHLQEGTNIYSWLSPTFQNGSKRKCSSPMTPKLFANSLNLSLPDLEPPRAIIGDCGTHFCNDQFTKVMLKTVGENHGSWSDKLDDTLWAFRTAYKTPIGCTPYKLVYRKACHLPIELEHKAYWALKHANFDIQTAGDHRKVQLNELNELRDQAYENSLIYKEKTKRLHDAKIKDRVFNIGDRVLLFNCRMKIFSGKVKTRWSGPFTITHAFPYGTVELSQPDGPNFKVNGHRLKHYFREDIPKMVVSDLQTFSKD
nr:reverse transcriptase domain-containing protein [Tanacetum cinerariifolium]